MLNIGTGVLLGSSGLSPCRRIWKESDWRARGFVIPAVVMVAASLFACDHKYAPSGTLPTIPDEQPSQIMAQVVTAYHSISSYTDNGTVVDRVSSRGGLEIKVRFETFFKRPSKLRFNWTVQYSRTPGYEQHAVIWSDGTGAWTSYSVRGNRPEQKDTLDLAVAGATGASFGSARHIPRLLTDQITGFRIDELNDLRIRGYETTDNIECIVLVGHRQVSTEFTVWVGRQDHLIRRIEERSPDDVRVETRTGILVNQDIQDSRFVVGN